VSALVRRCGMAACASTDNVRPYPAGWRCSACTPSALAGVPEPDELLARHRQALARLAGTDTTGRNAA
jgi:hypothetical protein